MARTGSIGHLFDLPRVRRGPCCSSGIHVRAMRATVTHVPNTALPRDLSKPPLFKLNDPTRRAGRLATIAIIRYRLLLNYLCLTFNFWWVPRSVNRPVFHSARPQISTSIGSDSLQPYYRWGAECGNMAKPCSQ